MVGLFVAPVVPAITVAVSVPPTTLSVLPWFVGRVICFYLLALVLGSLVGLPMLFLLAHFRLLNWASILIGGSIVGVVSITVFGLLHTLQLRTLALFGMEGAASAAIFWIFWNVGPDPNRDSARLWVLSFIGKR